MRVLVTGATGFLGSWIVRELLRQGHAPLALVRSPSRLAALPGLDVPSIVGDVLDASLCRRASEGVDAIIHAAGLVSLRERDDAILRVNIEGTRNVLEAARERGIRAVHTSSIAAIGATLNPALMDERVRPAAPALRHDYIESKRASEEVARALAGRGLDVVTLNPGVILGPGDPTLTSTRIVLDYLRGALRLYPRGGASFCDARDVAAAHVAALTGGRRGERYIVAGENRAYRDFFEELALLTGLPRPFPLPWAWGEAAALFSDMAAVFGSHPFEEAIGSMRFGQLFAFFDSSKAARELGYRPRELASTLRDTVADQLARGAASAVTPELRAMARGSAQGSP